MNFVDHVVQPDVSDDCVDNTFYKSSTGVVQAFHYLNLTVQFLVV